MINEKENRIQELENHIHSIYAIIGNMVKNHPLDHIPKETLIEMVIEDDDMIKSMRGENGMVEREDVLLLLKKVGYEF